MPTRPLHTAPAPASFAPGLGDPTETPLPRGVVELAQAAMAYVTVPEPYLPMAFYGLVYHLAPFFTLGTPKHGVYAEYFGSEPSRTLYLRHYAQEEVGSDIEDWLATGNAHHWIEQYQRQGFDAVVDALVPPQWVGWVLNKYDLWRSAYEAEQAKRTGIAWPTPEVMQRVHLASVLNHIVTGLSAGGYIQGGDAIFEMLEPLDPAVLYPNGISTHSAASLQADARDKFELDVGGCTVRPYMPPTMPPSDVSYSLTGGSCSPGGGDGLPPIEWENPINDPVTERERVQARIWIDGYLTYVTPLLAPYDPGDHDAILDALAGWVAGALRTQNSRSVVAQLPSLVRAAAGSAGARERGSSAIWGEWLAAAETWLAAHRAALDAALGTYPRSASTALKNGLTAFVAKQLRARRNDGQLIALVGARVDQIARERGIQPLSAQREDEGEHEQKAGFGGLTAFLLVGAGLALLSGRGRADA